MLKLLPLTSATRCWSGVTSLPVLVGLGEQQFPVFHVGDYTEKFTDAFLAFHRLNYTVKVVKQFIVLFTPE